MRSFKTMLVVIAYVAALLLLALAFLGSFIPDAVYLNTMTRGPMCYLALLIAQFALIILIVPAMTSASIAGERERRAKLQEETGMEQIPAAGFFRERIQPEGLVFFDITKILEGWFTTSYYMARAREVLPACRERSAMFNRDIQIDKNREGVRKVFEFGNKGN